MLISLPGVLSKAFSTDADAALIIPSSHDTFRGVPIRTRQRSVSAVAQALSMNSNAPRTTIATPIPTRNGHVLDEEMTAGVREAAAERELPVLELTELIRSSPGWNDAYRVDKNSESLHTSHQDALVDTIAAFLASSFH